LKETGKWCGERYRICLTAYWRNGRGKRRGNGVSGKWLRRRRRYFYGLFMKARLRERAAKNIDPGGAKGILYGKEGLNMAIYKTKYFGDFEANDDDEQVTIETLVQESGEDVEVSIVINYFYDYKDRIDEIIEMLDKYFEMHEAAKVYIEKNYPENDQIIDFLFKYAGEFLKREYHKKGGKTFSLDLENMIRRLDPPSVSFQKYQSGELLTEITYYALM
jgi:hypothetical protein